MSAAMWIQHGIAAAIALTATIWLIRRATSRRNGEGPCASCGLQRTMKRSVTGPANRTK